VNNQLKLISNNSIVG